MKKQENIKLILFLPLLLSFNITSSQPLRFTKEKIEIKIYQDYSIVEGVYTFDCKTKFTGTLFYPFPIKHDYEYPEEVFVYDEKNEKVNFTKSSSGIYFNIKAIPDSETTIRVGYKQKISNDEMRYILLSTQQWKSPLQKAEYIISLPKEFDLQNISIAYDKMDSDLNNNIYYITKEYFMPEVDLIIKWARREK